MLIHELTTNYNGETCLIRYAQGEKFCVGIQWRIQEIQNQEVRSWRGWILRSWICFDAPSHIPFFVARVVNKIHNVNIVYWLKSKYMRVIQSKFTKTNRQNFSKWGGHAPAFGINMVSDYTVPKTKKMVKWPSVSDNTVKRITQVWNKTGLTVLSLTELFPFTWASYRSVKAWIWNSSFFSFPWYFFFVFSNAAIKALLK